MRNKLLVLALTLTLVAVFSHAAFAAGPGNKCICPNHSSCQVQNKVPLAQKLNLSDRQVQQLKEINLSTYQKTKVLKVKLMDARFELRQLRIEGTDNAAIDTKTKEVNNLRAQIKQLQQEKWQKIQSMLTPEQQSKLKDMKGFGQHGGWCREGCQQPK